MTAVTHSKSGLWCLDGQRGEFEPDGKPCKRCGKAAWQHWTVAP